MHRCLIPEVQAKSYDVVFTPVLRQDEKAVDLAQHSLYIVEIRVHPLVVSHQHNRYMFLRFKILISICMQIMAPQDVMP